MGTTVQSGRGQSGDAGRQGIEDRDNDLEPTEEDHYCEPGSPQGDQTALDVTQEDE